VSFAYLSTSRPPELRLALLALGVGPELFRELLGEPLHDPSGHEPHDRLHRQWSRQWFHSDLLLGSHGGGDKCPPPPTPHTHAREQSVAAALVVHKKWRGNERGARKRRMKLITFAQEAKETLQRNKPESAAAEKKNLGRKTTEEEDAETDGRTAIHRKSEKHCIIITF
jgi:hypothetical protein